MAERKLSEIAKSLAGRKVVQLTSGFTLLSLAVLSGEACGGGKSEKTYAGSDLTQTANQTEQARNATPTPNVIVIEPTAASKPTQTPEPILPTATPEKILSATKLSEYVNTAIADLPDKAAIDSIKRNLALAEQADLQGDPNAQAAYANVGQQAVKLACDFPDNKPAADAVKAITGFAVRLVKSYEDKGVFAKGASVNWAANNIPIPLNCPNPFLNPPKK